MSSRTTIEFGTATNLHVLDLSGNAISSLQPNAFHRFTALRHLSLSGNKLSRLSLPTLPTLLTLRLVDNRLTALPDLRAFDSLYELYLTNHHVHTLDLALLPQHGNIRRMELAMAPALARGAAGPGAIVYTSQHTQVRTDIWDRVATMVLDQAIEGLHGAPWL